MPKVKVKSQDEIEKDVIRFLEAQKRYDLALEVMSLQQRAAAWEHSCLEAHKAHKTAHRMGFAAGKRQGRVDVLTRLKGADKKLLRKIELTESRLIEARLLLEKE